MLLALNKKMNGKTKKENAERRLHVDRQTGGGRRRRGSSSTEEAQRKQSNLLQWRSAIYIHLSRPQILFHPRPHPPPGSLPPATTTTTTTATVPSCPPPPPPHSRSPHHGRGRRVLARGAPGHRGVPVEPHTPMVLHLGLPPRLPRRLRHPLPGSGRRAEPRRRRHRPSPSQAPPRAARRPTRSSPGSARAADGGRIIRHLRGDAAISGSRDTRHAVVVARAEPHHTAPVAPLLPSGHPLLRPRLLLVLRLLPLPVPPRGAGRVRGAAPEARRSGKGVRARRLRRHGVPVARVLPVVPGARHPGVHARGRRRARVQVLGRRRTPRRRGRRRRTRRARLPARTPRVQPRLPRRRRLDALRRRRWWVQRDWCVGLQHPAQRRAALGLPALLRQARRLRRRRRRRCRRRCHSHQGAMNWMIKSIQSGDGRRPPNNPNPPALLLLLL